MPTNAIEISARPLVLFVVLILLASVYVWPIWLQNDLMDKITSIEVDLQEQSKRFDQFTVIEEIIKKQNAQDDRIQSFETVIQNQNNHLEKISVIEKIMVEQRDILNTALGHPVHMPSHWENELEGLEEQLFNPELWPQDASQSTQFLDELSALVSELKPLAEANYFPRLAPLRWAAIAFEAMHREPKSDEGPFALAERLRAIVDAKPTGIDSTLETRLRKRAADHEEVAEEELIDTLIQRAQGYLDAAASSEHDSSPPDHGIDEVYDNLGIYVDHEYVDHEERKERINGLRTKLRKQILERDGRAQATALEERWAKTKELVADNASVYESTTSMILPEVTIARSTAALQGIGTSDYDGLLVEIQKAVEDIEGSERRDYQEWALREIMKFEGVLGEVIEEKGESMEEGNQSDVPSDQRSKERAEDQPEVTKEEGISDHIARLLDGGKEEIEKLRMAFSDVLDEDMTHEQYLKVRDAILDVFGKDLTPKQYLIIQNAMISYLLPIDRALLDLPVLKRYQREFDRSWDLLKGRDEQTCVAIAAALVKKRTFRDLQDDQPEAVLVEGGGLWTEVECGQ